MAEPPRKQDPPPGRRHKDTRRGPTPIRLTEPLVAFLGDDDYQQAVAALAAMIAAWWQEDRNHLDE